MFLLSAINSKDACSHPQLLTLTNNTMYTCLKGDIEALLLNLTESFNLFNAKAISGCKLFYNFLNHIFFFLYNCSSLNDHKSYLKSFDHLYLKTSSFSSTFIIVTNASAILSRNIQAIFIVYF